MNVLTRETSIGKPNRRSARCRYEETTFRSPCVPGRSGPARGVPSSSRPVPGLPSVPCDSSAAASPNSRPRRSGGVNATTTYGMVQEAIMHKRFKNLRAARGRPEGSRPSARRCRRRAGAGRVPGRAGRRPGAAARAYRPAVVQANVGVRPGDCRGICQDRRIGRRSIRRPAPGSGAGRGPAVRPLTRCCICNMPRVARGRSAAADRRLDERLTGRDSISGAPHPGTGVTAAAWRASRAAGCRRRCCRRRGPRSP